MDPGSSPLVSSSLVSSSPGDVSWCAPSQCNYSKVALIGLGVILIIGGALSSWLLNPYIGNSSFYSFVVVPIGIMAVVAGLYCAKVKSQETNRSSFREENTVLSPGQISDATQGATQTEPLPPPSPLTASSTQVQNVPFFGSKIASIQCHPTGRMYLGVYQLFLFDGGKEVQEQVIMIDGEVREGTKFNDRNGPIILFEEMDGVRPPWPSDITKTPFWIAAWSTGGSYKLRIHQDNQNPDLDVTYDIPIPKDESNYRTYPGTKQKILIASKYK